MICTGLVRRMSSKKKGKGSAAAAPAKKGKQVSAAPASPAAAPATAVDSDELDPIEFLQPSQKLAGAFGAATKQYHDLGLCARCSASLAALTLPLCRCSAAKQREPAAGALGPLKSLHLDGFTSDQIWCALLTIVLFCSLVSIAGNKCKCRISPCLTSCRAL